jgi:polyvinyl alcohol dehydrogenase (cytochrome)
METRFGLSAFSCVVLSMSAVASTAAGDWPSGGQDIHDTRAASNETAIRPDTVGRLAPKWVFTTTGNLSATPAVDGSELYVPDWGGRFYRLDARTGTQVWNRSVADYTGVKGAVSRTAPALDGDTVFIGSQLGAYLLAIDRATGALRWKTQLDAHPAALITQAPVVYQGRVYLGVSSQEEVFAVDPTYPCCTFRGSVLALDEATGKVLWRMRTVPDGYSGGSVWGGTPVVDEKRRSLYITTGNNYSVPAAVNTCLLAAGSDSAAADACLSPRDLIDGMMALDLDTGAVKWGRRLQGADAWTGACFYGYAWCPDPVGDDYDLGPGAALFTVDAGGHARDLVGGGQKSGIYWALDPEDGSIVWSTLVGPGGIMGGIEWGTATDGKRIYVAIGNTSGTSYTLVPSGQVINWGSYSALDAATGKILWQTPDPVAGSCDTGMVTIANGVMLAGSMDAAGHMYALDAATGKVLWSFASGGSVVAGPAVADGVAYWGSGYYSYFLGTPNNQLYAFDLGPKR